MYIYIYIYTSIALCLNWLHPVSVTRFPSFRTQTLESLSHYLRRNGLLSNPDPGENLVMENLVMETGCIWGSGWGLGLRSHRLLGQVVSMVITIVTTAMIVIITTTIIITIITTTTITTMCIVITISIIIT